MNVFFNNPFLFKKTTAYINNYRNGNDGLKTIKQGIDPY